MHDLEPQSQLFIGIGIINHADFIIGIITYEYRVFRKVSLGKTVRYGNIAVAAAGYICGGHADYGVIRQSAIDCNCFIRWQVYVVGVPVLGVPGNADLTSPANGKGTAHIHAAAVAVRRVRKVVFDCAAGHGKSGFVADINAAAFEVRVIAGNLAVFHCECGIWSQGYTAAIAVASAVGVVAGD